MLILNKKIIFFFLLIITFIPAISFAQQKEGVVKIETNAKIDEIIAKKKQFNKSLKEVNGYKIQLFYGNEKNSHKIKEKFKALYPKIDATIIFSSPQWKVQVGNYRTRLEADRNLVEIKKEYSGAIVIASEIELGN
jgi:hypothetical protein